jgi:hypothetical protein
MMILSHKITVPNLELATQNEKHITISFCNYLLNMFLRRAAQNSLTWRTVDCFILWGRTYWDIGIMRSDDYKVLRERENNFIEFGQGMGCRNNCKFHPHRRRLCSLIVYIAPVSSLKTLHFSNVSVGRHLKYVILETILGTLCSTERWVSADKTTRWHNQENPNLSKHCC